MMVNKRMHGTKALPWVAVRLENEGRRVVIGACQHASMAEAVRDAHAAYLEDGGYSFAQAIEIWVEGIRVDHLTRMVRQPDWVNDAERYAV